MEILTGNICGRQVSYYFRIRTMPVYVSTEHTSESDQILNMLANLPPGFLSLRKEEPSHGLFPQMEGRERWRENCQGRGGSARPELINGGNSYGPSTPYKSRKGCGRKSQPQKKLCEEKERRTDALYMITSFT